ncbi:hypothetical protein [Xenorhabdus cabanillasii]|uniref:hypothetical protein n=1 Tax=Xenorhabdus cabanillasii TaxID=351673 RepID=UPI0004ADC502|nr:hypothetical protein [Xenorhabdus cabanillasii]
MEDRIFASIGETHPEHHLDKPKHLQALLYVEETILGKRGDVSFSFHIYLQDY